MPLLKQGWPHLLQEESILTASSVTKTRLAHKITACTLVKLMRGALKDYWSEDRSTLTFEEYQDQRMLKSPQFQFWHLLQDLELIIFTLIRSFREWNHTLPWRTFWTDPILLRKQQRALCSLASSSHQRYDVSWAAAIRCHQRPLQRKLCYPQVQKGGFCPSHQASSWTEQFSYQRWKRSSFLEDP